MGGSRGLCCQGCRAQQRQRQPARRRPRPVTPDAPQPRRGFPCCCRRSRRVLLLPGRPAEVRQGRPLPAISLGQETSLTDAPLLDELLPLLSESQCSRPHAPRMGTAGKQRGLSVPWVPSRAPRLLHKCRCCWRHDALPRHSPCRLRPQTGQVDLRGLPGSLASRFSDAWRGEQAYGLQAAVVCLASGLQLSCAGTSRSTCQDTLHTLIPSALAAPGPRLCLLCSAGSPSQAVLPLPGSRCRGDRAVVVRQGAGCRAGPLGGCCAGCSSRSQLCRRVQAWVAEQQPRLARWAWSPVPFPVALDEASRRSQVAILLSTRRHADCLPGCLWRCAGGAGSTGASLAGAAACPTLGDADPAHHRPVCAAAVVQARPQQRPLFCAAWLVCEAARGKYDRNA